jgi:hypothetical protein
MALRCHLPPLVPGNISAGGVDRNFARYDEERGFETPGVKSRYGVFDLRRQSVVKGQSNRPGIIVPPWRDLVILSSGNS